MKLTGVDTLLGLPSVLSELIAVLQSQLPCSDRVVNISSDDPQSGETRNVGRYGIEAYWYGISLPGMLVLIARFRLLDKCRPDIPNLG